MRGGEPDLSGRTKPLHISLYASSESGSTPAYKNAFFCQQHKNNNYYSTNDSLPKIRRANKLDIFERSVLNRSFIQGNIQLFTNHYQMHIHVTFIMQ